jgi:lantibiotic modifying enzyme
MTTTFEREIALAERVAPAAESYGHRFLDAAQRIGERLLARAVWSGDRCTWTADELEPVDGRWTLVHRTLDGALYSGTAGIARFLAHLAALTGDERHRAAAQGALRSAWSSLEAVQPRPSGLFTGELGVACIELEVAERLRDERAAARARERAAALADPIERATAGFDLIDGLAGVVVGLAFLARHGAPAPVLEAARRGARRLEEAAIRRPHGWYWPTGADDEDVGPLCGLAHGASGVALALAEAAVLCGEPRLMEAARQGIRFEKSWLLRGWSAWRECAVAGQTAELPPSLHWCRGTGGIGLARLRLHQLTGDPIFLAEAGAALHAAEVATRSALASGRARGPVTVNDDFSVCHGFGSLLELFSYAHEVLGQSEPLERGRELGRLGARLARARDGRFETGVPGGDEHPGLLLGTAGIGMSYLRLGIPGCAPSVTLLV